MSLRQTQFPPLILSVSIWLNREWWQQLNPINQLTNSGINYYTESEWEVEQVVWRAWRRLVYTLLGALWEFNDKQQAKRWIKYQSNLDLFTAEGFQSLLRNVWKVT